MVHSLATDPVRPRYRAHIYIREWILINLLTPDATYMRHGMRYCLTPNEAYMCHVKRSRFYRKSLLQGDPFVNGDVIAS